MSSFEFRKGLILELLASDGLIVMWFENTVDYLQNVHVYLDLTERNQWVSGSVKAVEIREASLT